MVVRAGAYAQGVYGRMAMDVTTKSLKWVSVPGLVWVRVGNWVLEWSTLV